MQWPLLDAKDCQASPSAEPWEPISLSAGPDGFIYGVARYHGGGLTRLIKMDANGALTWGT